MLIRIRRHNNKCKEAQVTVSAVIIPIVFIISKACYMDKKLVFRILCGSIYLMFCFMKHGYEESTKANV